MGVRLGECMRLLRVTGRLWVGDLVFSDVCEATCAREDVCAFGSVTLTLNQSLIYPLTLTTTAFQPQSKTELQDALQKCSIDPVIGGNDN